MKFLVSLVNLMLLALATIGDFVLFYLKIIFWVIIKITRALYYLFQAALKNLKTIYKNGANNLDLGLKNINTKSSTFFPWSTKLTWKNEERHPRSKLRGFKKVLDKSKLATFRFSLSLKAFRKRIFRKRRTASKTKRIIEERSITIYPAPRNIRLKIKFFLLGFLICFFFILIPLYFYFFLNSLPNPKQLSGRQIPQTTKIYDRNGALLYQIYANENRTLVPLSSIPKDLINATIAIEDKDFYKNPGFDINAIIRAAVANFSGKPIQGGSTLTQQLIKTTLLTPEITLQRKIKEIILAFWAEKIYTKNEILEMYFNQVPYGGTAWGVEAAAETYFGKNVKELDLAQSAFLAVMPQAPSVYFPYGESPNLWKTRQKDVLDKMQSLGFITKEQRDSAYNQSLVFKQPQTPIYAPHFVMYVKDLLVEKYGLLLVEKGGLSVTTTLDLKLQKTSEDIVREEVANNSYLNLTNGATLITNPKNGDILAMVGSKDYNDPVGGNVNVTTSLRQPGSSIKIVTYSSALSNGFTAATILDDSPVTYNIPGSAPYSPVNYDGGFHGKIPLRIAFANSFNVPAVKTLAKIGIPTMIETGKKMGITTWNDPRNYGLSITLGAAEVKMTDMAVAYGTVANLGKKVELNPILKISDYQHNILYEKDGIESENALDAGVSYIISSILSDNSARSWEFGTSSPLNITGHTVSVKTGTSDNKRDNWTIGFTPSYLVAVWVGNNDNSPMSPNLSSGITGAAPIWNKLMTILLSNVNDVPQQVPENIIQKKCGGRNEYFIKGTENLANCSYIATPSASFVR